MEDQKGEIVDAVEAAAQIRKVSRKVITLPGDSGAKIEIRKLHAYDFITEGLDIPVDSLMGEEATKEQKRAFVRARPDATRKLIETIIIKGVVSPRVLPNNEVARAGELNLSDLAAYFDFIIGHIAAFSGLGAAAGKFFQAAKAAEGDPAAAG